MSLTLSSRPRLLDAIRVASDISLGAYVLSGGGMLDALASAAPGFAWFWLPEIACRPATSRA